MIGMGILYNSKRRICDPNLRPNPRLLRGRNLEVQTRVETDFSGSEAPAKDQPRATLVAGEASAILTSAQNKNLNITRTFLTTGLLQGQT
jgi:hypothetical protein